MMGPPHVLECACVCVHGYLPLVILFDTSSVFVWHYDLLLSVWACMCMWVWGAWTGFVPYLIHRQSNSILSLITRGARGLVLLLLSCCAGHTCYMHCIISLLVSLLSVEGLHFSALVTCTIHSTVIDRRIHTHHTVQWRAHKLFNHT